MPDGGGPAEGMLTPTLGELDLHLLNEGRHLHLQRALGAHLATIDGVDGTAFSVWAPAATGVSVVGDFNWWDGGAHPMTAVGSSGVWALFVPGVGEGATYKYAVRGASGWPWTGNEPLDSNRPLNREAAFKRRRFQCSPPAGYSTGRTRERHEPWSRPADR